MRAVSTSCARCRASLRLRSIWAIQGRPDRRLFFDVTEIRENIQVVKMVQGTDDLLLSACIAGKVDGIVIEGISGGHVTNRAYPAVLDAICEGIPVVVTSRTFGGGNSGDYAHLRSNLWMRQLWQPEHRPRKVI